MLAVVAALVALAPGATSGTPAATAVVTGRVVAPFPLGGKAGGAVHLARLDTGAVAAAVEATKSGYRASVPPGVYIAAGYALDLGRRAAAEGYSRAFRVTGRKRLDLRLTPRGGGRALASATAVEASAPAVGIGTPILLSGVGDLSWMLGTELTSAKLPCAVAFVEESPRFKEARRKELALSRSGLADPATRVQDRAIKPGLRLTGTATMQGGVLTVTLLLTDARTGRPVAAESQSGRVATFEDFQRVIEAATRKIAGHLCSEFPIRYRVLAASFATRTVASKRSGTGICDAVGGTSGSIDFSVRLPAAVEAGRIDDLLGALQGQVVVFASGGWTNHEVSGCRITASGIEPCSTRGPDVPQASQLIGFSVTGRRGAATAELLWEIPSPSVGTFTDLASMCFVFLGAELPLEARKQTVALSRLTAAAPATLTFSGERTLMGIGPGDPAVVTYSWSYSITIQRVS